MSDDGIALGLLVAVLVVGIAAIGVLFGRGPLIQAWRDAKVRRIKSRRAIERMPKPAQVVARVPKRTVVRVPLVVRPRKIRIPIPPPPRPLARPTPSTTRIIPPPKPGAHLTYSATPLLSKGERAFYDALLLAIGNRWQINLKPRLADLIGVRSGPGFFKAFHQISQKHVDFVLIDPTTLAVVILVELDDTTHRQYRRAMRDTLVNRICREAGLRLIHFKARASYNPRYIVEKIEDRLRRY